MRNVTRLCSVFLSGVGLVVGAASGQFSPIPPGPEPKPPAWSVPGPRPVAGVVVAVDVAALGAELSLAPEERVGAALAGYGRAVALPHPDGGMVECFVARSPVMEPGLAAGYPGIQTYVAQTADRGAGGRIELTQRGLTGMLRSAGGVWMIDPWQSGDATRVVAYWLRDLPGGDDWTCHTVADANHVEPALEPDEGGMAPRALQNRRSVRTAVACTGEYGLHHCTIQGNPPNAADPLAAIVTVVARANVVYEADIAVHFDLVENNDAIVFFDPETDPYPDTCDGTGGSDCSGPLLAVNIATLTERIGLDNFDLGHLLTRVYGGVAYLRSVCKSTRAGGISGIPRGGDADPFSALVVIHEFGHQFGANHTFSGTRGRCGNNANLATAWEAGSGSSPMAYAGGCPVGNEPPSDNVAIFADPYFHHGSINEMRSFLVGGMGATCLTAVASSNNQPVITSVTPAQAIPPGTAFMLTATATDADGDVLTYSWEQFDSGVRRPLEGEGSEDNGMGALFRVFPPVLGTWRSFPQMGDVLAGVATPGERLPEVATDRRRFRVIVRDNVPGAGAAVVSGFVDLAIPPSASAFAVTAPVEGEMLHTGPSHPVIVIWSVGGTNLSPITCTNVAISYSIDGGSTFLPLGTFPNTGSASVTFPSAATEEARVRVSGEGRIFFAVSRPFTLVPCAADFNGDGVANTQDFFDYLGVFFAGEPAADFNNDDAVNSQDFFDFLAAFFAGC